MCEHAALTGLRDEFWVKLDVTLPGFRSRYSDPELFFRAILGERALTGLLGKLAFQVLEIVYATLLLVVDPSRYAIP